MNYLSDVTAYAKVWPSPLTGRESGTMRGRKPDTFLLKAKDAACLRELLSDGQTPLQVARRAQILLNRNNPQQRVVLLGMKVEQDTATVWRVCERYRQGGLSAALYDAPRSGRPRVFSPRRTRGD
jgi:hypothetical protein